MTIPNNTTLYEHPIATFWFDETGILCSVSKSGARTVEIMTEYIEFVKDIIKNRKVCILTDISNASPMNKETREFVARQLETVYKAMAILTDTPVGTMIGKVFTQLEKQPYPISMFSEEDSARKWLLKHL